MYNWTHREGLDGPDHQVLLGDVFGAARAGLELGGVGITRHRYPHLHIVSHGLLLKLTFRLENTTQSRCPLRNNTSFR